MRGVRFATVGILLLMIAVPASAQGEITAALARANQLRAAKQFPQAIVEYQRALGLAERQPKNSEWNVASVLAEYGNCHVAAGEFAKAEPLFEREIEISRRVNGVDHPNTADGHLRLARLYEATGRYNLAETRYILVLGIRVLKLGPDHPSTAVALNNQGELYKVMGQYAKAEQNLLQCLAIREAKLGKDHQTTAVTVNNLAVLYTQMGQYAKAEPLCRRALAIKEARLGLDDVSTARTVNNLAALLRQSGRPAEAEPLYKRSLAVFAAKAGPDDPETALALINLAFLYRDMGKYDVAEPLFRQVLDIRTRKLGEDHPDTAYAMGKLAGLYRMMNQDDKAEPLLARAVSILRGKLGGDHPSTASATADAAGLLAASGRWENAVRFFDTALHSMRKHSIEVLPILADREQQIFLAGTLDKSLRQALTLGLKPELTKEQRLQVAGWAMNGKNVAAESLSRRLILARDADTPQSRKTLAELDDVRRRLARASLGSEATLAPAELDALKAEEKRLSTALGGIQPKADAGDGWFEMKELVARLPEDAAFVDVVRFAPSDFRSNPKTEERYVAFVSSRAAETLVVDLGEAGKVDAAIREVRKHLEKADRRIAAVGEPAAEKELKESLGTLGRLVMDPLKPHLAARARWIISPDSLLWLVPWTILPDGEGYAAEKHRVQYVVSGRDLAGDAAKPKRAAGAPILFADPDFDLGLADAEKKTAEVLQRDKEPTRGLSKDFKLGNIKRLPATATEAEAISPRVETLLGKPKIYSDAEATAGVFRAVKSPRLVVLSTHGFFLEDERTAATEAGGEEKAGPVAENPLLRCGLLLAGCNNAAKATPGQDNGVLSGLEIVGTDLRGTEMVVLSACETGLGEVRNGEGVAGLRQAFQLAGAESVVATLWQVPDVQSAQLMVGFFDNLSKGQQRDEALRNAQIEQIQKRRAKNNAAHPFYWAAYTVTGQMK